MGCSLQVTQPKLRVRSILHLMFAPCLLYLHPSPIILRLIFRKMLGFEKISPRLQGWGQLTFCYSPLYIRIGKKLETEG